MADWIVSIVLEKLNTIIQNEVARLLGVNDKFEELSRIFTAIQGLLEDVESQRLKYKEVKIWVERVKDVAYDVDGILEWTMEALISQKQMMEAQRSKEPAEVDGSSISKKTVRSFFSPVTSFNHFVLRHKIGCRIKDPRKRLASIAEKCSQLSLEFLISGEGERLTSSLIDRRAIVGREYDKNEILELLLSESREEVPFVIPIVGMGGLGKTTLAQLVYNDEKVKGHFDMKMWVCVSKDFDLTRITKSIIEYASRQFNGEHLNLDQLQPRLREMLRGKRFLVVLDDVWSSDREKWDRFRLPFKAGALGSGIIVTTHNESVAWAMGSTHIHKLQPLSDDDCWLLFSRRALEHRSAEERTELEEIGREIVKKCKGLPLTAKSIGGAMFSRRTRREWELVLESDIWNSDDILGGILRSYQELPPDLKQCFIYCSIFPKDWLLEKDTMVKLWVAQGFIRSDRSTDLEEMGGQYFNDLLKRSLLQDAELDDDKKLLCKMHDLVHDLAQSMAGSDYSVVDIREQAPLNPKHMRHSFLIGSHEADKVASIWPTLYKAHELRTLLLDAKASKVPDKLFRHLKSLRVLDLSRTDMKKFHRTVLESIHSKFPRTVLQLIHLRYLDLSYTGIEKLPAVGGLAQKLRI